MSEQKSTALATRSFSLLPSSMGEAREFAELIAASEFAPKDYKGKPANIILAIQMGADVGLKPMQSLQAIAVINGRPSLWGDGALAVAIPALDYCVENLTGEGDEMVATCRLKRKGWPEETIRTFSVKDAKAAGLWTKSGTWSTYPKRMLQMRARSWALRDACSDLLMGLAIAEEAMDFPDAIDAQAVRVEAAPVDMMERVPEGLRDNVEKMFSTLNMVGGQRLAKLNEYFGKEGATPEEAAQAMLEWGRDELSKRKTGKPRAASNNKSHKPTQEAVASPSAPAAPASSVAVVSPEAAAPIRDAEIVETTAPKATEIGWGNQGQKASDSELF